MVWKVFFVNEDHARRKHYFKKKEDAEKFVGAAVSSHKKGNKWVELQ